MRKTIFLCAIKKLRPLNIVCETKTLLSLLPDECSASRESCHKRETTNHIPIAILLLIKTLQELQMLSSANQLMLFLLAIVYLKAKQAKNCATASSLLIALLHITVLISL